MEALVKKYKKMTTAQLTARMDKSIGDDLAAIKSVLESRNGKTDVVEVPAVEKESNHKISERTVFMEEPTVLTPDEEAMILRAETKHEEDNVVIKARAAKEAAKSNVKANVKAIIEGADTAPKAKKSPVETKSPEVDSDLCVFKVGDKVIVSEEGIVAEVVKLNVNPKGVPYYTLKDESGKVINRKPAKIKMHE